MSNDSEIMEEAEHCLKFSKLVDHYVARHLVERIKRQDDELAALRKERDGALKLLDTHILRSDLFSYLAWLEDNRKHEPDVTGADYLVLASDGTTCWGKTFLEAVQVAEQHDRALFDSAQANGGAK